MHNLALMQHGTCKATSKKYKICLKDLKIVSKHNTQVDVLSTFHH